MSKASNKYIAVIKVLLLSCIVGIVSGIVGSLFSYSVEFVTELRIEHGWLLYLLPIGGLATVGIYKLAKLKGVSTNTILESVRTPNRVPVCIAPVMFVCTVITHLFGGSAGREGAALQIGGGIASYFSVLFKLDEESRRTLIQCGMAAMFSALFGTPFAAVLFALEVVCVGHIRLAAVIPCSVSGAISFLVAQKCGLSPERFICNSVPGFTVNMILKVILIAVAGAVLSSLFCKLLHFAEHYIAHFLKNEFIRVLICGCAVVLISVLIKTTDYNGGGLNVISRIFTHGEYRNEAFLLKILLTVLTVAGGYKGGEIVPSLFIGATFGAFCGGLVGVDVAFAAAIGAAAMFCGISKCLLSSIIISAELFGFGGVGYYALACIISFVFSGKSGLFKQDRIRVSEFIGNIRANNN